MRLTGLGVRRCGHDRLEPEQTQDCTEDRQPISQNPSTHEPSLAEVCRSTRLPAPARWPTKTPPPRSCLWRGHSCGLRWPPPQPGFPTCWKRRVRFSWAYPSSTRRSTTSCHVVWPTECPSPTSTPASGRCSTRLSWRSAACCRRTTAPSWASQRSMLSESLPACWWRRTPDACSAGGPPLSWPVSYMPWRAHHSSTRAGCSLRRSSPFC